MKGSSTLCATAGRSSPKATSWLSGLADDVEQKKDAAAGKEKDKAKKSQAAQENRFLMVTVSFDPTLIDKPESMEPKPFVKTAPPAMLPDNVIAPDPKDPKFIADQKAAEDKKAREKSDYEKKIADGQEESRAARRAVRSVVLRHAGR